MDADSDSITVKLPHDNGYCFARIYIDASPLNGVTESFDYSVTISVDHDHTTNFAERDAESKRIVHAVLAALAQPDLDATGPA